MGRVKQGHSSSQLSRSPRAFYKGNFTGGVAWLFINVFTKMEVFEVDASAIKSLMSGIYLIIKKLINCQALYRHPYLESVASI